MRFLGGLWWAIDLGELLGWDEVPVGEDAFYSLKDVGG